MFGRNQSSQTGDQLSSGISLFEVSECSLDEPLALPLLGRRQPICVARHRQLFSDRI